MNRLNPDVVQQRPAPDFPDQSDNPVAVAILDVAATAGTESQPYRRAMLERNDPIIRLVVRPNRLKFPMYYLRNGKTHKLQNKTFLKPLMYEF